MAMEMVSMTPRTVMTQTPPSTRGPRSGATAWMTTAMGSWTRIRWMGPPGTRTAIAMATASREPARSPVPPPRDTPTNPATATMRTPTGTPGPRRTTALTPTTTTAMAPWGLLMRTRMEARPAWTVMTTMRPRARGARRSVTGWTTTAMGQRTAPLHSMPPPGTPTGTPTATATPTRRWTLATRPQDTWQMTPTAMTPPQP